MTTPAAVDTETQSGYERLDSQLRWYDTKSTSAQFYFKRIKVIEFALGALVPLTATLHGVTTAILGAAVIVLEGCQQLFQWQHNWITYRSTCEALRHEKFSYLARSGAYEGLDDTQAKKQLVERVEGLVSTEHSKWLSMQQKPTPSAAKPKGQH